jgi:hypothetical protein
MIVALAFVFANVYIAYRWFELNPNGYTGHKRRVYRRL